MYVCMHAGVWEGVRVCKLTLTCECVTCMNCSLSIILHLPQNTHTHTVVAGSLTGLGLLVSVYVAQKTSPPGPSSVPLVPFVMNTIRSVPIHFEVSISKRPAHCHQHHQEGPTVPYPYRLYPNPYHPHPYVSIRNSVCSPIGERRTLACFEFLELELVMRVHGGVE